MNKIQLVIIIALLHVILATVTLAETLTYEGWLPNNKFLVLDEISYRVLLSDGGNTLLLTSAESSFAMDLGSCQLRGYRKFCYNNTYFDSESRDYQAYMYIYVLEPDIQISRTVSNNILWVGDTTEFTVTIRNIGESKATQVVYTDDIPNSFEIVSVNNAKKTGNSVIWTGDLDKGQFQKITYVIKGKDNADTHLTASVKYYDGFDKLEIFSDPVRLYCQHVLYVELVTDKTEYELKEDIDLTIHLINRGDEDIDVEELNIYVPQNIKLIDKDSDISGTISPFTWEGLIRDNRTDKLEMTLNSLNTGPFFVVISGEYKYLGNIYRFDNIQIGFLVTTMGADVISSLDPNTYVNSGQLLTSFLKIRNLHSFSAIHDVEVTAKSSLGYIPPAKVRTVDINQTVLLMTNQIQIPIVSQEESHLIFYNVSYLTEDNYIFSKTLERKIIIKPRKLLGLSLSLQSESVEENSPVKITVSLQNPSSLDINEIYLESLVPTSFKVKGPTSLYSNIEKFQDKPVFEFIITPGVVTTPTEFNISVIATYLIEGAETKIIETKKILVRPVTPNLEINKILSSSKVHTGELIYVTYEITNLESSPLYNLFLTTTKTKEFDTLNIFEYLIPKLDPREKMIIYGEQLRAKISGSFTAGPSMIMYSDEHNRRFNKSSDSPAIQVEKAEIDGPSVLITKLASNDFVTPNEIVTIVINLTNMGLERAVGNLSDFSTEIIIPFYETKIFTKNISFNKPGVHVLPSSVFYFNYKKNEARAYSNELIIVVEEEDSGRTKEQILEEYEKSIELPSAVDSRNFFQKVIDWFKGLFKK